jgi:hypothetical protein
VLLINCDTAALLILGEQTGPREYAGVVQDFAGTARDASDDRGWGRVPAS